MEKKHRRKAHPPLPEGGGIRASNAVKRKKLSATDSSLNETKTLPAVEIVEQQEDARPISKEGEIIIDEDLVDSELVGGSIPGVRIKGKSPLADESKLDADAEIEELAVEGVEIEELADEQAAEGKSYIDIEYSPEGGSDEIEGASSVPALTQSRLPVPRDSFQIYVREVSGYPLLKPEEEKQLARQFRDTKDPKAAFKLVSSHLRLVVKIAIDFQRRWMQNVLDLVQEGNVGLMHALNKFDPDKGIKFSYYASFWIKAYMLKFVMDNFRMVKIGTTQVQRKLFFNLNRERQKLVAQGYDPDDEMLSKRLGVSPGDIQEMNQRLSAGDVSLNLPVGDEQNTASRMDFLPALGPSIEESISRVEMSKIIRKRLASLLPSLNEKEIYILNNRLLTDSPSTLREIGERYSITRERVRQLEIRLIEKIKRHFSGGIKDFSREWLQH